jgi:hypothetical protein
MKVCKTISVVSPKRRSEPIWDATTYLQRKKSHYFQDVANMASISMGFQKPNGLKYNDIMDEYGTALIKDSEFWSDISLLPLVKCQYIRERIRDSLFSLQTSGSTFNVLPFQAEMNVQAFHNEVEEWKRTVPEGIKSMRMSSPNNTDLYFLTQSHSSHDPR